MNFELSEEQHLLQQTVRQYLENECPPTKLRAIFEGETGFDPSLWKGMVEMGLAGLHLPDSFGGAGLEMIDLALVSETLGWGAAPGPFLGNALAGLAILLGGSDEQKQRWLPRLAGGDAIGTVAFDEAGGLWQPEEWALAPGRELSGTKLNVPFASLSDVIVVGLAGGQLALVEKIRQGHRDPLHGGRRPQPPHRPRRLRRHARGGSRASPPRLRLACATPASCCSPPTPSGRARACSTCA